MSDGRIYLNGINGLTGQYLAPPLTPAEAAALARQTPPAREKAGWFGRLISKLTGRFFGLPMDVDPTDLAQAGWAVVFPAGTPDEVRRGLQPLIDHRARQAPPDRCKQLTYAPGQSR